MLEHSVDVTSGATGFDDHNEGRLWSAAVVPATHHCTEEWILQKTCGRSQSPPRCRQNSSPHASHIDRLVYSRAWCPASFSDIENGRTHFAPCLEPNKENRYAQLRLDKYNVGSCVCVYIPLGIRGSGGPPPAAFWFLILPTYFVASYPLGFHIGFQFCFIAIHWQSAERGKNSTILTIFPRSALCSGLWR